jgi:hypothetical protein
MRFMIDGPFAEATRDSGAPARLAPVGMPPNMEAAQTP